MYSITIFYLYLSTIAFADLEATLDELNKFLEPAGLDQGVMAQLGKTIAENEWEENKQKFADKFPDYSVINKYLWQFGTVLQHTGVQLCEPCLENLPEVQEFLRGSGLAAYAVEIALCNLLYAYDDSLVPVCDVGLAGLSLYLQNAQPQEICGLLPSCAANSTKKREADQFFEATGRHARTAFRK